MDYYHPKDEVEKKKFLKEAREKLVDCKIARMEVEKKAEPLNKILNVLMITQKGIEDYIKFLETGEL
jgi:hypothetical protein